MIQCRGDDEKCTAPKDGNGKTDTPMVNLQDNAYVAEIHVGTPPQKIRALFDTGSTNAWILNVKTPLSGGAKAEFSFDESKSSTYKAVSPKQGAEITFGSGSLSGYFVTDTMTLGSCSSEKKNNKIEIKNQKFGSIDK